MLHKKKIHISSVKELIYSRTEINIHDDLHYVKEFTVVKELIYAQIHIFNGDS